MAYSLNGAEKSYRDLVSLQETLRKRAPDEPEVAVFRHYEKHLFPERPDTELPSFEDVEAFNRSGRALSLLEPLTEELINIIKPLPMGDRLKRRFRARTTGNARHMAYNDDKGRLRTILNALMDRYGDHIREKVGGDYSVVRVERQSTVAGATDKSGLWHFDPTPIHFFKLFIYLNGEEEHDGATHFLNGEHSLELLRKNYHVGDPAERADSPEGLGYTASDTLSLGSRGGVGLFTPDTICHRGIYPSRGTRDVLIVSIIPAARPWHENFETLYSYSKLLGLPPFTVWPRWYEKASVAA